MFTLPTGLNVTYPADDARKSGRLLGINRNHCRPYSLVSSLHSAISACISIPSEALCGSVTRNEALGWSIPLTNVRALCSNPSGTLSPTCQATKMWKLHDTLLYWTESLGALCGEYAMWCETGAWIRQRIFVN